MLRALVGPTASGKTEVGIALAERLGCEIVSADSMLVYRGMDVGTAKPTQEQRARVPHHLIDLVEPSERFTVSRYQHEGRVVLARIARPLLVGGSGLYVRALADDLAFPPEDPDVRRELEVQAAVLGPERLWLRLGELDPVAAAKIAPANVRRVDRALEVAAITGERFSAFADSWERFDPAAARLAGLRLDAALLSERVARRVASMLEAGWLDEVRALVERGLGTWLTSSQAIGYAELAAHLDGRLRLEEAVERTIKRTRELARRQMAWFRRDPRIRWFDVGGSDEQPSLAPIARHLEAG